jgi:hypothetical protein
MPESSFFGSPDELIKHIKSKADDIDTIYINYSNALLITNGDDTKVIKNVGGVIRYCSGQPSFIHATDLERLLNDSGIRRLNIPFKIILPNDPIPKFDHDS